MRAEAWERDGARGCTSMSVCARLLACISFQLVVYLTPWGADVLRGSTLHPKPRLGNFYGISGNHYESSISPPNHFFACVECNWNGRLTCAFNNTSFFLNPVRVFDYLWRVSYYFDMRLKGITFLLNFANGNS